MAIKTPFGWTLFGHSGNSQKLHCAATYTDSADVNSAMPCLWEEETNPPTIRVNLVSCDRYSQQLHEGLQRFWTHKHIGILPQKEVALSSDDVGALLKMEKETRLVNGHYEVPMLWAEPDITLPDDYIKNQKFRTLIFRTLKFRTVNFGQKKDFERKRVRNSRY